MSSSNQTLMRSIIRGPGSAHIHSPRRVRPIQAKQARCAETDARASQEIRLRRRAIDYGPLAIIRRRGARPRNREPPSRRAMEEQSDREFASPGAAAGAQDATLQERRLGAEIAGKPWRRLQHLQRPTPSHLSSNAPHASRRGDERVAGGNRGSLTIREATTFRAHRMTM